MGCVQETKKDGELVASELEFAEALRVGQCAFMQVGQAGTRHRQRTVIRGWHDGKSLLLDKPPLDGQSQPRKGERCAVRYVQEGVAWGFRCVVAEYPANSKVRHFGIGWPDCVFRARIRNEERIEAWIPCSAALPNGELVQGTLCDISVGGCRVELKSHLSPGETFGLSFVLPSEVRIKDVGVIVRCKEKSGGAVHCCGCEFLDLPAHAADAIRLWSVREQLAQRRSATGCLVVLTQHPEDANRVESSLGKPLGLATVPTPTLLDVGYWLHQHRVRAVFVNMHDFHVSPTEMRNLVHAAAKENPLVVVYGNGQAGQEALPEAHDDLIFVKNLDECQTLSGLFGEKDAKTEDKSPLGQL